jgi:hypothetical protein
VVAEDERNDAMSRYGQLWEQASRVRAALIALFPGRMPSNAEEWAYVESEMAKEPE